MEQIVFNSTSILVEPTYTGCSYSTATSLPSTGYLQVASNYRPVAASSTRGNVSFVGGAHTQTLSVGQDFEESLLVTLGMAEAPLRSPRPGGGAVGELTPIGDAVLPMLACVLVYMCARYYKKVYSFIRSNRFSFMKRSISTSMMAMLAVITMLFAAPTEADAQLKAGDTITVSYTTGGKTYYVARSGNTSNLMVVQGTPTKDCLWVLATMKGSPSTTGKENAAVVTARNVSAMEAGANSYFYLPAQSKGTPKLVAQASASQVYTNKSSQAINNYIEANVYIKGGTRNYYLYYSNSWQANTSTKQTYRIQKWSSVTENVVRPTFLPTSKIFDYAENTTEADNQQIDVTCKVVKRTAQYYYNVSNQDQRIVIQAPQESDADPGSVHFAWKNLGETQMSFTDPHYNSTTKEYEFKVKPNGPSPVTTDTLTDKLIDIENYIVCTATFDGKPATGEMHCIRRKYWQHTPPKLEFSVTHPTYRFAQSGGKETLTPYLWLQDLTEWVNTDGIVEHRVVKPIVYKEEGRTESVDRYRVKYPDIGLSVTIVDNTSWITLLPLEPLGIPMTATVNTGEQERSTTILIRVVYKHFKTDSEGNFLVAPGKDGLDEKDPEKYQIEYMDEFTRQVTFYQDGTLNRDAQIQFHHKGECIPEGQPGAGQQKVHTNKKILYYVPGDKAGMGDGYGSEVELRPAEMAFFAYRRWYNYDNGHGIQNGESDNDNTIWANAPHITNGRTSYNYTPINTDNQNSRGVFAIARSGSTSSGFRILYSDMTDAAPVIRGYRNTSGGDGHGVHTIACDLSAFTDYVTEPATGNTITSLTEPTLSYRMLFELHPANEIADSLQRSMAAGKYLEEYEYTAPTGVDVHLTTSQRFRSYRYHKSELGYYYWNNSSLVQIQGTSSTITWNQKIESGAETRIGTPSYSPNTDNLIVSSRTEQTIVYTLTINVGGANRRIAKFTVHYKKPTEVGPSAVALLTNQEIADRYQVLRKIDWDDLSGKSTNNNVIAGHHLDWEDATFGYAYQVEKGQAGSNRPTNKDLCYYGEYLLLNSWNSSNYGWMDKNIVNHSGKGNGFMLFADGTMEPSMVASIHTDVEICSGQQMYCSAWVANACPAGYGSGANPIFRFNVQGRNADNEEWEDVQVFFAGELPKGSGWRQIKFPVTSHESFSQTRVCVYNFATTNTGNDFFLDDITLFATPLPISAYQAASACSGSDVAIVVKVDYQNVAEEILNKEVYYQGWVEVKSSRTGNDTTIAIPNLHSFNGYYQWYNKRTQTYSNMSRYEFEHPDAMTQLNDTVIQDMGLLHIPSKDYEPSTTKGDYIALSVQNYIEYLQVEDERDAHGRAGRAGVFYVQGADGKYSMYLAHLLGAREGGHYEIHFAEDSVDLASPLCAMSVQLPIYKKTRLSWNDDTDPTTTPQTNVCPNVEGEIKVTVTNTHIADNNDSQGSLQTTFGKADWLIGIAADSIYGRAYAVDASPKIYYGKPKNGKSIPTTRADSLQFWKDSADVLFEKYYGYTRHEVQTAFVYDFRRMPYVNNPNDNYDVSNYQLLDSMAFLNPRDYTIVKDLCKRGLVDLNISSRTVMLSPGDSLFLWVFPIVGSATLNGKELEVCNEPQWVDFRTTKLKGQTDEQVFNPSPIANKDKTPMQRLTVPSVRVTASKANEVFGVPIMDLDNAVLGWDSLRVIETNDPNLKSKVDAYRTAYNDWASFTGAGQRPAYPAPETFSMRYYADKVYQGTNGVKVYTEGTTPNPAYHSNTKNGLWHETNNPSGWRYYQPGDTMFFRPINSAYVAYLQDRRDKSNVSVGQHSPYSDSDANWVTKQTSEGTGPQPGFQHVNTANDTMRANYTYKMTTKLITDAFQGELNDNNETPGGCNYATTYFDVIVVPELLIWRPTVSNEWGDDANWRGIVNGVEMAWGFAPLKTSSVIIPKLENELLYPVVTGENLYPMSAWYEPASCDNIYMEAGAHILGQEKLNYNKAYVDMPIEHAHWQAVSSPMRKMYSGDFFVPQTPGAPITATNASQEVFPYNVTNGSVSSLRGSFKGTYGSGANQNEHLFDAAPYQGTRSTNAPYAFWTNYYNRTVQVHHHNISDEDATTYNASATFAPSNSLHEEIVAGQGVQVLGYGPWSENETHIIPLRLPKVDTQYEYYLYGQTTPYKAENLNRGEDFYKFAWKSDNDHPERMTVTLTNEVEGKQFLMGNPTMAYIDLHKFMNANNGVLTGTFGYMHNEKWVEVSREILDISGHRFLAPMEAIMVQIAGETPKREIQVVFVDSMMTLDDMRYVENAPARAPEAPASAPSRAQAASDANAAPIQLMTITAFTDDMEAVAYLGKKEGARNGYLAGEDAYAISSGVEDGTENDDDIVTTPLNIYTVSDSTALMVDLRPGISVVPLHFLTHAAYRTDSVNLICNMNMDWSTPCYFIDSVAGTREPIMNGYVMKIALPENHQSRYYIEGPDPYIQDAPNQPTNPGTATAVETVEAVEEDLTQYPVEKFIINGHLYIRRGPALFHVTGTRLE